MTAPEQLSLLAPAATRSEVEGGSMCSECGRPTKPRRTVAGSRRTGMCADCSRRSKTAKRAALAVVRMPLNLRPNERMAGEGCASGPGVCLVIQCRHNLIGELRPSGTYVVGAIAGRGDGVSVPISRDNAHTLTATELDTKTDEVVDAMLARIEELESSVGSTCGHDVKGPLRLDQIGAVLNLSSERVRQIEYIALRKLKRGAGDRIVGVGGRWSASVRDMADQVGVCDAARGDVLVQVRKRPVP